MSHLSSATVRSIASRWFLADFHGLPTHRIENECVGLDFLAEAGPRIVRLFLQGSDNNLLAELPDVSWPTPNGEYHVYGGHRLWHAPESRARTYVPDDSGLIVEDLPNGVRLSHPAEQVTGIAKRLEIRLHPDRAAVSLRHQLTNESIEPVECAPWAITQLRLGGTAILPQPIEPLDADGLLPNRHLVLWPYARWDDPRLRLGSEFILIEAHSHLPPLKIGYFNRHGWIAYLRAGTLFVKRFEPRSDVTHPDFNSNVEVYCNDQFIELETLAPLARLEPGQTATHDEIWELHTGVDAPSSVAGARSVMNLLQG